MYHAETALRIANALSTKPADLSAHKTVYNAADQRHRPDVVHAIADKKGRLRCGPCRCQESIDLFRKMLTIGIEKAHPHHFSIQAAHRSRGWIRRSKPVTQPRLNRFAFTAKRLRP